jgi:hypothetical protein
MKADWVGPILRTNYFLKHVVEGNIERGIELTRKRGRREKQLLDDFKEAIKYFKLNDDALDRNMGIIRFGRACGPVIRQTTE